MIKLASAAVVYLALFASAAGLIYAQSINSGTVTGTVTDQSNAIVRGAKVTLRNPVTGYDQSTVTDESGVYRFNNVPQNGYRLTAAASGFSVASQEIDVRSSVPMTVNVSLTVSSSSTTINVEASGAMVEQDPSAHIDVDRNQILKLPILDPGAGLSKAIVYSTGGVADDGNGFF